MEKETFRTFREQAGNQIDEFTLESKLKMIAFQDQIFEAKRKLSASENRLADLQKKLDNYLQNKEHQLAEVTFTAHMNAQRIEAQARSQTESIIMQIDEELRCKQQDLRLLQNRNHAYLQEMNVLLDDSDNQANPAIIKVVEDSIKVIADQSLVEEQAEIETAMAPAAEAAEIKNIELLSPEPLEDYQTIEKETDTSLSTAPRLKKSTRWRARAKAVAPKENDEAVNIMATAGAPEIIAISSELPAQGLAEVVNNDSIPVIILDKPPDMAKEQEVLAPVARAEEISEKMRLDAFVDLRYYDNGEGKKQLQHHALQVTIEVDVPETSYSVRYTKVSSDFVSALLRYDNVVLNDIFPFNIIAPDLQNIAIYFFNYIEDILALADLGLHSLTVVEIPDVYIQIKSRNKSFDHLVHQDEDMYRNLRESIQPCVEPEGPAPSPFKERLNRLLGKRY
ncbi:MAG: hypothetical protein NTV45_04400 [Firmicutes bacterium]|nr:hypothetical protein [Bacillota bacterium]